jgi:MutS domain V
MATCAQVAFFCASENMNTGAYYTGAIGVCDERLERIRRRIRAVSGLRLLVFAGLVWTVVELIRTWSAWWAAGTIGFAGAFIGAVNWYFRLKDHRLLWEKLVFVNTNEWAVMQERPNGFPDGKNFLAGLIYGDDLDIFGPLSVFHALNRTTTLHGTEALAGWLRKPLQAPEAIRTRQEAVRVLAGQADLRRLLTAKGLLAGGEGPGRGGGTMGADLRTLKEWLNTPPRVFPLIWLRVLIGLWTVVNVVLSLYGLSEGNYTPVICSIAITWIITGYFSKYIQHQHQLIGHKQAVFEQYADILSVFSGAETGESGTSGSMAGGSGTSGYQAGGSAFMEELREQAMEAHGAIRRLSRLTSFFDQRLNLLVFTFLNSLAFYDLQCMVALERWKSRYRDRLPAWIEAVGNIEALNSLATYAFNHPGYVYPAVNEGDELLIEARQLAHPLIPANRCVANDFRIGPEEKLILVTGSNMSGKTTFLRTIGVNVLLAQCGSPVCAAAFSFTPVQLLTSLRISDSLQEQTSYFMAELKKLRQVVEILETGAPALVLIDEILRGTNSEDKTYGSEHFAKKLVGYRCLALFATHDLALGALESELPGKVANYCFESVIENGDLRFDYRLQRGIARNKNASFLMKKMGII